MKIKVLQLEPYMKNFYEFRNDADFFDVFELFDEIEPRFNRDGYYCAYIDNKWHAWFEIDGKAFTNERLLGDFEFQLNEILLIPNLSQMELKALDAICNTRYATRKQKDLLYHYKYKVELVKLIRTTQRFTKEKNIY